MPDNEIVSVPSAPACSSVRVVAGNAGFNALSLAVSSLAALLLLPFLLRHLGESQFGVWALLGVLISLAQLVDVGLGRALVLHVAQRRARRQLAAVGDDVNRLLWPLLVMWLGLVGVGSWVAPGLVSALGTPLRWLPAATVAGRWLVLAFLPVGLSLLGSAVLEGMQQMIFSSAAQALARLIFAGAAVVAVLAGLGLAGVAAAYVLSVSVQAVVLWLAVRRVLAGVRWRLGPKSGGLRWADHRFGANVLAVGLIALAFTATNKVALARWVGLESLAYYELATVIALQMFALALAWARAAYPALATAQVEGGMAEVRRLYLRALRLLVMGMAPVMVGMITLSLPFMTVWLGEGDVWIAGRTLQALAAAWGIAAMASVASVGFLALRRPGWPTFFSALNLALNGLLILLLTPRWGLGGVVAANAAAVGGTSLLTLGVYAHLIGAKGKDMWSSAAPPLAWAGMAGMLLAGIERWWWGVSLGKLLALAAIFVVLYAGGLLVLGILQPRERAWLLAAWQRLMTGAGRD